MGAPGLPGESPVFLVELPENVFVPALLKQGYSPVVAFPVEIGGNVVRMVDSRVWRYRIDVAELVTQGA